MQQNPGLCEKRKKKRGHPPPPEQRLHLRQLEARVLRPSGEDTALTLRHNQLHHLAEQQLTQVLVGAALRDQEPAEVPESPKHQGWTRDGRRSRTPRNTCTCHMRP